MKKPTANNSIKNGVIPKRISIEKEDIVMGQMSIEKIFEAFEKESPSFQRDGVIDKKCYAAAPVKIMWVLKQDWVGAGSDGDTYAERLKAKIRDEGVQASPTWRRMAQVSYGLLHGVTDFDSLPECRIYSEALLSTAIIEADKELGETTSPNDVILKGFAKYRELAFKQIDMLKPDVIIVAMSSEALRAIPGDIYCHLKGIGPYEYSLYEAAWDHGDNVASSTVGKTILLWVCHPKATRDTYGGINDALYFSRIIKRYSACMHG